MSNMSRENKKIISIRNMDDINKEKMESSKTNIQANEQLLRLSIDNLTKEISHLENQKEKMLENLKQAIEKEKVSWEEQKEQEQITAQNTGYKIGYDAGYEEVFQRYENLLSEANDIVAAAKKDYDKTILQHEDAIVQLAIAAAEKIIGEKISNEPDTFTSIVKLAIEDLKDSTHVEVYVHPSQYKTIYDQKEELQSLVRKEDVISIYADKKLNETDCLVKNAYGQVDISIDTQLTQLKKTLEEFVAEKQ